MLQIARNIGLIVIVVVSGCDCDKRVVDSSVITNEPYIPEVRLVKDAGPTESYFYFRWNEPLKEERIIAVRLYYAGGFEFGDADRITLRVVNREFDDVLVYFQKYSSSSEVHFRGADAIEILSAKQRDAFPLPAYAVPSGELSRRPAKYPKYIPREYPLKPYIVGTPSRLLNPELEGRKIFGLFAD